MRKFLFLCVVALAFAGCGDDDNVWQPNSGGGNRPVRASKLISKIIVSGDTGYEEEVPLEFGYDDDNRLVRIHAEYSRRDRAGVATYSTQVKINHGKSTAVCEIVKTKDGMEFPDKSRKVIVLDDYGRAVSGDYVDYDYDIDGVYSSTEAQFELKYDRSGRLVSSATNFLSESGDRESLENTLTWKNNNLMEVKRNNSGKELADKAYYSDILNKANLDLNWLCYAHNRGFSVAAGDPENYFMLMGYFGKTSRNMPEMIVGQEASKNSRAFYSYETDKEGYVTSINVEKGNDLVTYRILYSK